MVTNFIPSYLVSEACSLPNQSTQYSGAGACLVFHFLYVLKKDIGPYFSTSDGYYEDLLMLLKHGEYVKCYYIKVLLNACRVLLSNVAE